MIAKYKPSSIDARSNIRKYLELSDEKISFIKKRAIIGGIESAAKSSKERLVEATDSCITIVINDVLFRKIPYSKIDRVVDDMEHIIVVNSINPLVIPRGAFVKAEDRNEFIRIINSKIGNIVEVKKSTDETCELKGTNTLVHSRESDALVEGKVNTKKLLEYKKDVRNVFNNNIAKRAIWILWMGLIIGAFISFLVLNHMGAFTQSEFWEIFIPLIILIPFSVWAGLNIIAFTDGRVKNNIFSVEIDVKYELLGDMFFAREGTQSRAFRISDVKYFGKTKRGIYLMTKNMEGVMDTFYIIKGNGITGESLVNFYDKLLVKAGEGKIYVKDKFKRHKVFNIARMIALILIIISWPVTLFVVPNLAPNYYSNIQKQKVEREHAKVMKIINANLYNPNNVTQSDNLNMDNQQ